MPMDYSLQHPVFVLSRQVKTLEEEFCDGVDITPDEVYFRMLTVILSTSQPFPGHVPQLSERIREETCQEAITVCMS